MTQYPSQIGHPRLAATLQATQQRLTKVETRTASIDSGFPLAVLPGQVDPSYSGSGSPMAYLNGAATLSGPYQCLSSYQPVAGGSVLLAPVGANQTYVILGAPVSPGGWIVLSLLNSWTGSGGGVNCVRFRLLDAHIEVQGDVINLTATGNSVCAQLPAGCRPGLSANYPAGWNNPQLNNAASAPWLFADTSGNLQVTGLQVANKPVFFHQLLPR